MHAPILLALLAQSAPNVAPEQAPLAETELSVLGGVEAPEQPWGVGSSAAVVRSRAPFSAPGVGASGEILVRIGDLVEVRGREENVVQGLGLVTGLAGTGDSAAAAEQALLNLLKTQDVVLDEQAIVSQNVAVVWVEATIPPGLKPGRRLDARVSSLYDAESLEGGVLVETELKDVTGRVVYATAAGAITTGGFLAEGEGAAAKRNHVTVGLVPLGAKIQRAVPTSLVSEHGYVYLDMLARKGSFTNSVRVAEAVNALYPGSATPQDPMTVAVRVPSDLPQEAVVPFLDTILRREIVPDSFARVVVNERTGVIVMGESVRITRGAITKGNLTVTIAESPVASQPGPLSSGVTAVLPRTDLVVEEEDRPLTVVNGAVTLQEVVEVLNVLGVTPRDMIQILESMSQSGMLHAEIVVL